VVAVTALSALVLRPPSLTWMALILVPTRIRDNVSPQCLDSFSP
jgi:hypothetical protein